MEYDLFELERPPRKVPTKKFPKDSLYPYDDLVMNEEFLRNPTCNNNTQEHNQINLFAHKVTIPQFGIKSTSLRHVQRRYRDLLFPSLSIKRIDDETNPDNPGKLHRLRLSGMRGRQSHNRFNAATYQRESRLIKAVETFTVREEPHTSGYRNQTAPHTKDFKEFVKIPRKKPYPYLNPNSPDYEPRFQPQGQAVHCKQEPQSDSEQEVASDVLENQERGSSQNNQLQQLDKSPKKQPKNILENAKKTVESRKVHNVELQEPSSNVININQKQKEKKSEFSNLNNNPPELEVYFTDFSFSSEEEDKNKSDPDKKKKKAKAKKRNTKNEPSTSAQRKPNTNPYIKSSAESLTDCSLESKSSTSALINIHFNTQNKAGTVRNISSSVNHIETETRNTTNKTDLSLQNKISSSDLQKHNDSVAKIKMDFYIRKSILEAVSKVSQKWINFVQRVITNDEPNELELRPIALKMISETCDSMINKNDKKIDMNEQLKNKRNKILRKVSDIILKSIPEGSTTRFLKRIHGKVSMRIKTKPSHISRRMNEMAVKIKKEPGNEDQDVVEVNESNTTAECPVIIIGDDTSSDKELVEDEEMLSNEEMFRRLVGEEQYLKIMYPKFINICSDDDENIISNRSDTKEQDSINSHNKSSDNNNANQQQRQVNVEVLEEINKEKIENRGCNQTTFRSNEHESENVHQVVDNKEDNEASRRIIESEPKIKLEVVSSEKNEEANQNERPCNATTSRRSIEVQLENEHEIVSNERPCNATTARKNIEGQTEDKHDELVDEENYELEKRKRTKSVHTNNNKHAYEVDELPTIFRRNDDEESEANIINVEKHGQCNKSSLSIGDPQTDGLNHIIGLDVSEANKNKPIQVNKSENKLVHPLEKKNYKSECPEVSTDENDTYDESNRIIGLDLVSFQFYNFKLANGRIMNHTHGSRIMTQRKNNTNYQNEFYYSSVGNYAGATNSSPPPKRRRSPP